MSEGRYTPTPTHTLTTYTYHLHTPFTQDLAFVENASHGMNAVLRSLTLAAPRNKILYLNLAYQMVKNTLTYVHNVTGEQLLMVNISFPTSNDAILQVRRGW